MLIQYLLIERHTYFILQCISYSVVLKVPKKELQSISEIFIKNIKTYLYLVQQELFH